MTRDSIPLSEHVPRRAAALIEEALADTRVVLIAGPRQSGKTTLARGFAGRDRAYLTLDDDNALRSARSDPIGFVRGLDRAVIDEVQRAPELLLAIKESVDRDQRPGRFLLTGSADIMALPTVADSLAGRMETVPLLPLARAEITGGQGAFLDRLFDPRPLEATGAATGAALVEIVLGGGYPEALRRRTSSRRQAWFDAYVASILDRDVRDIAQVDQLERMPRLLAVLAEHAGQLTNYSGIGAQLGMNHVTTQRYVGILERLFLVRSLPPWSTNRVSRLIKSPKLHFLDSGLLAGLRGDGAESLARERARFGALLESFVASEIMKLMSWSSGGYRLSHFRTREGDEVDLVVEDRRGRIVGIEIKASATLRPADLNGLRKLAEAAGDTFVRGVVLHDHDRVTPYSDKLSAAPITSLWA